jgi:hypothetical protein
LLSRRLELERREWAALASFALAALLLVAARSSGGSRPIGRMHAAGWIVGAVACSAAAAAGLLGNGALGSAVDAAQAGDLRTAQHEARIAGRLAPWSSTPLLVLADLELRGGYRTAAEQHARAPRSAHVRAEGPSALIRRGHTRLP